MNQSTPSDDTESTTEDRKYPFGFSSKVFFILVILLGLIMPGLLVTLLERANLPTLADIAWVFGYGTTIFTVWYMWIRPRDWVGPSGQKTTRTEPNARTNEASETLSRDSDTGDSTDKRILDTDR